VAGRDGLADVLHQRRAALNECSTKWTPDVLHFLLELSDQPVDKSDLRALDLLREPDEVAGPPLRWEDIAAEDGWADDRALWRNIDYADSSDDGDHDASSDLPSDSEDESSPSSLDGTSLHPAKSLVLDSEDSSAPADLEQSQSWRDARVQKGPDGKPRKVAVSEFHVIREVLFMLQGLETSLFDASCSPVLAYQLRDVSWDTYRALVDSIAESGRKLLPLRKSVLRAQETPLLQVFQESIRRSLAAFDRHVSRLEARFVAIQEDTVVSLVAVLEELKQPLAPLFALSAIIRQLQEERYAHAFRYLELLFDATCAAQLEGNEATYTFLGTIFFDCFQVYLRPIRVWMEEGELAAGDKTFFVTDSASQVPLSQIWQRQFKLRRTTDGVLHAPKFLQPSASRIFTTGKSIVVLKHLGKYHGIKERRFAQEPTLSYESVCRGAGVDLAPFAQRFDDAFDGWIQSKHHPASKTLQRALFESCGLWSSLGALESVFLATDGSVLDAFALPVFHNLDTLNPNWCDRFTLTELAHEAFAATLETYRLSVVENPPQKPQGARDARRSVRHGLSRIKASYRLGWPVQLIIPGESIADYHRVFTTLLQIRRATHILLHHRLLDDISRPNQSSEQALYYTLRSKLLWFATTFYTYLTNLVLAPGIAKVRGDLRSAEDVDMMIAAHSQFIKSIIVEACLGSTLRPIKECILDVLDLAIKLEDSRRASAVQQEAEIQESFRLSTLSSPMKATPKRATAAEREVYVNPIEKEEAETSLLEEQTEDVVPEPRRSYMETLRGINSDFERHIRFVSGGLRGVARASGDAAAAGKWDVLADLLETGMREQRQ